MVSYNLSPRFFRPWGTLWMFNLIATLFHLPFCSPVPKSCGNPFQNSGGCYSSILIPMVFEWLVKQSHMGLILSFSSVLHLPPCIGLYSREPCLVSLTLLIVSLLTERDMNKRSLAWFKSGMLRFTDTSLSSPSLCVYKMFKLLPSFFSSLFLRFQSLPAPTLLSHRCKSAQLYKDWF